MINLIQWRASIGLWCSCISSRTKKHTSTIGSNCRTRNSVSFRTLPALLVLFLSLLLIRSGDAAKLNPGPTTGNTGLSNPNVQWLSWKSFGLSAGAIVVTVIMIITCCWRTERPLQLPDSSLFNKPLDVQCKRKPLFGFEACHRSWLYQNPDIRRHTLHTDHCSRSEYLDQLPANHLRVLYESQNTSLCQVLAQSIKNHSLCLYGVTLSQFDAMCLSYFINNSNVTWNHLHFELKDEAISTFTNGLTNNSPQSKCKRLEVELVRPTGVSLHKFLQPLFLIQECYCVLMFGCYVPCLVLLDFLDLPQLKILHLCMEGRALDDSTDYTDKYSELVKRLEMKSTLQEMYFECWKDEEDTNTISSVIKGIARNKTMRSFTLSYHFAPPLPDGIIEHLLKDNCTLQALTLDIDDVLLTASLNVNTPLTALQIQIPTWNRIELMKSLLLHIKGLHCLILHRPHPLPPLFHSHPSLQSLAIPLETDESVIELFTILRSNTTLKALKVKTQGEVTFNSQMCTSLQDMLTLNQTLQYLEIETPRYYSIPSSYLSYLTTGLINNTSLQELSVPIPLVQSATDEQMRIFFNVLSQKNNLTELQVYFRPEESYKHRNCELDQIMAPLFYEQGLSLVTNMLQSHTTIRLLRIQCVYVTAGSSQPNWIEIVQQFYEAIFLHSSLEYIDIEMPEHVISFLKNTLKTQQETLIARHRQEQPLKPLPIVDLTEL